MNLCKDCKHYNGTNRCYHTRFGMSPVSGKPVWEFVHVERGFGWLMARLENMCGKEGRYFEAKQ